MPRAVVANAFATAEVYLHGAHATAFAPRGVEPVLWLSDVAEYRPGKAIRGGVPVVYPWFGPHPTDESKPQHGFARTSSWSVVSTDALADGRTVVGLRLTDDLHTRALWPHPFVLDLRVVVGSELHVELAIRNAGAEGVDVGAALHTYLRVGDVGRVAVEGLDGCRYVDRLDRDRTKRQDGPVVVDGETDRVYLDAAEACVVDDPSGRRRIRVAQSGSRSTVVWNPWVDKARWMADFPDDGYRTMLCIEAANAGEDVRRVAPGSVHTLSQTISVESAR